MSTVLFSVLAFGCGNQNSSNDEEDLHTADTPTPTRSVQLSPPDDVTLAGSTLTLTWTASPDVSTVALELTHNGDTVHVIDDAVQAQSDSYEWTIPDDAGLAGGTPYRILLYDVNQPAVFDFSDTLFIVDRAIAVTQPREGDTFTLGGDLPIAWDSLEAGPRVSLALTLAGEDVATIAESEDNTGEYLWTLPTDLPVSDSGNYRIRVQSTTDDGVLGVSAPFSLQKHNLMVTSPDGGELLVRGQEVLLEWSAEPEVGAVDVELWSAGEQSTLLAESVSDGYLLWTIPDDIAIGEDYQIAVRDADLSAVMDLSNETFAITGTFDVTEPTKDDVLRPGEQMTIRWSLTAPHGEMVDILLERPDSQPFTIATAEVNDGEYVWSVPLAFAGSDEYQVVIRDTASGLAARSGLFSITGWRQRVPITVELDEPMDGPLLIPLEEGRFDYALVDGASEFRLSSSADILTGFDLPIYVQRFEGDGNTWLWTRAQLAAGTHELSLWVGADNVPSASDFDAVFVDVVTIDMDQTLTGPQTADAWIVDPGITVTVSPGTPFEVTAPLIEVNGTIDAFAAGHPGAPDAATPQPGEGPGGGGPVTDFSPEIGAGGGGYGGRGGDGLFEPPSVPGSGGVMYGDTDSMTIQMGSGGGSGGFQQLELSGAGGGAVLLQGQYVSVDGSILADGEGVPVDVYCRRCDGGGSGGGILLTAKAIDLHGMLTARGGIGGGLDLNLNPRAGGGGGGGRIKVFHQLSLTNSAELDVSGGQTGVTPNSTYTPAEPGESGTVTIQQTEIAGPEVRLGAAEEL